MFQSTFIAFIIFLCLSTWVPSQEVVKSVDYELFAYDQPSAKVEVIIPKSWNADFARLSQQPNVSVNELKVRLELIVLDVLDFKVDDRVLPTPSPTVHFLIKHEEAYLETSDPKVATHLGYSWGIDAKVSRQLSIHLEKPVFGARGLYQSLLDIDKAQTGIISTYPQTLDFAISLKTSGDSKPLPLEDQLRSFKQGKGPSPRIVFWAFLGLLFLILQVRKSRSISTRSTAVAMASLAACVAAWFLISPWVKFDVTLSKLPQDQISEFKKNKEARVWLEQFIAALNFPAAETASPYFESLEESGAPKLSLPREKGIRLISFVSEKRDENQPEYIYRWTAVTEDWAWGKSLLHAIEGKVKIELEPHAHAKIVSLKEISFQDQSQE